MQRVGTAGAGDAHRGNPIQDPGGPNSMGGELPQEGELCPRPRKRQRLLGSPNGMVREPSELAQGEGEGLFCEESLSSSEEEGERDPPDESGSEEEGGEFTNNAYRWGVAFRKAIEHPWTDAQWVAYWKQRGYFLTPGEPFPLPLHS